MMVCCSKFEKMKFLWLLSVMLPAICSVSGVTDDQCDESCNCCLERKCHIGTHFHNTCTDGCIDGHRGGRCYELCQYENCKSCGGITNSNVCSECYDGYYLGPNRDCRSQCPPNCKSCTSSTACSECKEGFYDKDGSTTCPYVHCPANCECNNQGDCVLCKKGYFDTSTSCTKQCPVTCLACESKDACSECKTGFYNGYEYDNNNNLQLNNCTYRCRDNCTQCQSYNTCLQCIDGNYGQTCQDNCSVGCKDKTCLLDSGKCTCTVHFTGDTCMKCIDGKYGLLCNEVCSKYCKENICERTSGDCTGGCINENMSGITCNACKVGRFNELCDKICPRNCKDFRCEKYSGNCSNGCLSNFNGTKCEVCINGKFGTNCDLNCPVHCAGIACERDSGACFDCDVNFQGEKCDECESGYYGANCVVPCSPHCSSSSCNSYNGTCVNGCKKGYSGDKCCVMSQYCVECESNTECRKCVPGFFKTSCNETCLGCCGNACDIKTGKCILSEESQQQKDALNTVPVATAAVLGSLFAILFAVNIVLLVVFLIWKRKIYRRKNKRPQSELTYENQLGGIDIQFPRTTSTDTSHSETFERNVYEGISKVNEKEHEYQQMSKVHQAARIKLKQRKQSPNESTKTAT